MRYTGIHMYTYKQFPLREYQASSTKPLTKFIFFNHPFFKISLNFFNIDSHKRS